MGEDEVGTLAALKAHRQELIDPIITDHHGRIVRLMGDGALVEFASVVDAVECAVEIQQAMASRNAGLPEDQRIVLRIGLNIGDIIVENDDIHGDGVNLAARLEGIAEPGGICISQPVFDQIHGKISIAFKDAGERQLKNIARPVHVWGWTACASSVQAEIAPIREALPLPEKPSIAVLPFVNMSGDPGQDYFCDGITEDIITDLSRFRSLFVIARHSSFAYRGHANDLRQVGRELGVEHIVEGSLQRAGKRARVTVQLIDAESGHHIWAERYDRELKDIFAVQDEVTSSIAGHVTKQIDDRRLQVAKRRHPESLQAYDHWLQANQHLETRSLTGIAEGRRLLERALELDPQFARAYADLSRSYLFEAQYLAGGTGMQDKIDQAFHLAQTAVSLDDSDSRSLTCMGRAHLFRREFQLAGEYSERATSFNPCDATALMFRAQTQAYIGDPATGVELANRAARLNPYHPEWYRLMFTTIYFLARRYQDSFEACHLSHDVLPDMTGWKAAVCAQLDRLEEARGFMDQFVRNVRAIWIGETPPGPGAYKQYLLDANPLRREEDVEHLLVSLRKAGLPE